jgi:hypothetical protein
VAVWWQVAPQECISFLRTAKDIHLLRQVSETFIPRDDEVFIKFDRYGRFVDPHTLAGLFYSMHSWTYAPSPKYGCKA